MICMTSRIGDRKAVDPVTPTGEDAERQSDDDRDHDRGEHQGEGLHRRVPQAEDPERGEARGHKDRQPQATEQQRQPAGQPDHARPAERRDQVVEEDTSAPMPVRIGSRIERLSLAQSRTPFTTGRAGSRRRGAASTGSEDQPRQDDCPEQDHEERPPDALRIEAARHGQADGGHVACRFGRVAGLDQELGGLASARSPPPPSARLAICEAIGRSCAVAAASVRRRPPRRRSIRGCGRGRRPRRAGRPGRRGWASRSRPRRGARPG